MNKNLLSVLFVLLLTLAVAGSVCAEDPIKIGYVGALSGDTALWGQAGLNGLTLTAEMINAEGGIIGREVQIIGLDGKGAADDSVAAYKRLVEQEGVVAVVGTNFSSCNIPIAAVSDELHVPVIATAASNELVTVDANGKLHPYSFRLWLLHPYQAECTYEAESVRSSTQEPVHIPAMPLSWTFRLLFCQDMF